jgi:outer membrane protein assembly factor BamD
MAVGRYYLRASQPLAAIGRFKTVIDRYQTTTHTPEALYRLVEAYLSLGLVDEARRNAAVLGHNYAGDSWYADAYALMTDRGLRPATAPRAGRFGLFRRKPDNVAGERSATNLASPPSATPESLTRPESEAPNPEPR